MTTPKTEHDTNKWIALKIAKEQYNMAPVVRDDLGGYVLWVRCQKCGKRYQWNQSVRQYRHYLKCQRGIK